MPKAFTIHYACGSLIPGRNAHVTAISVCDTDTEEIFGLSMEDAQKVPDGESDPSQLELRLLEKFFQFVSAHPDALWIHWQMNGIVYGFDVLRERYEMVSGTSAPKIGSMLNLPDWIYEKDQGICRRYPNMYALFREHKIKDPAILSGEEEAARFQNAEYAAIRRSSEAKAKALAQIYDTLQNKRLATPCTPDKKLWVLGMAVFLCVVMYLFVRGI
ncbi:MAG: hypothetical protein ABXS92_00570 [Sulfurimonas sp.]